MAILDPTDTTVRDLCGAALQECGAFGFGQRPRAEDFTVAQSRMMWMLQQWERKTWLVWHVINYVLTSTGQQSYTVGPGGEIDTGTGTVRPARLESAFLRQLILSQPNNTGIGNQSPGVLPLFIDFPLEILKSRQDYDKIALKGLVSFANKIWYDPQWPLGVLYPWPIPQASIYGIGISVLDQLPLSALTNPSTAIRLPEEYFAAIVYNLALRLRPHYGLLSAPGDQLRGLAKDALNVLRSANLQIAQLQIPADMNRPGIYNVFSDQFY